MKSLKEKSQYIKSMNLMTEFEVVNGENFSNIFNFIKIT